MDVLLYILALIFSLFFIQNYHRKQKKRQPPSPPALPIIGHLHLLRSPKHRALQHLSSKYGPVVYLRLGTRQTLLVSSPSIVEECFTKNDIIFANRPHSLISKYFSYQNNDLSLAPYGDHWRNLRRLATTHVFSSANLNRFSAIRTEEVLHAVQELFSISNIESQKVNLRSSFSRMVLNVAMKMLSGKKFRGSSEMAEMFSSDMPMGICDYLPIMGWLGFGGFEKRLVKHQKMIDEFLQDLVDESRKNSDTSSAVEQNKTIIQSLLSLQEADPEHYHDDLIKGIMLDVSTAGTDTVAYTMEWVMSLLLNHPEVLQKVRSEIDLHVIPGCLIQDSDLPKLSYLRCVINETLRLIAPLPLLLPHFSSEDCIVNGFNVPRGTTLLVDVWSVHRDPNVWEEPLKFKPEMFEGMGVEDEKFKYFPFGVGRRACPGSGMAMRLMGLALGSLIQCFEWNRVGTELVDLEEGDGLVLPKVQPLEAFCKPRPSMAHLISHI